MKRHRDHRRIAQPQSKDGADLAETLWKKRHELTIEGDAGNPHVHHTSINPTLRIRIDDGTHIPYALSTRTSDQKAGRCSIKYDHRYHSEDDDRARWVLHAWRAVRAARLLVALGEDAGTGDAPLCVPRIQWVSKPIIVLAGLLPRRPTASELLEDRLDGVLLDRIARMPTDVMASGTFDVGNGVRIDANTCEPIIVVSHDDHGSLTLPGRAAQAIVARVDAERVHSALRLEAIAVGRDHRIDRVLAICREAVAMDPDMTDASGTPIRPLLDSHLPRLARVQEDLVSTGANHPDMEQETDAVLGQVIKAVEEGMASHAQERRDALRTELRFLAERHPANI